MIPEFPQFKKLEFSDKKDVEKFTSKFPPYSDFNFISMWIWDISNNMEISQLNKNLVVVFSDYISGKPFISFIGKNKISETALELINFSKKNYQTSSLKLIPEEMAKILMKLGFSAIPDLNSHDYIYSTSHLANMDAWHQNSSSKRIRQFIKKYPDFFIRQYSSVKKISKNEYLEVFKKWTKNKKIENYFELSEYKAFEKLFQADNENIKVLSLYLKNILIGFSIFEILADNYAISHFIKADISFHSSVYDILNFEEAKILKNQGIKYYNWEQDLGIQGLRNSKLKYKPSFLLKKYKVSLTYNN
ncbi:DUF2156 domain-containing protein [Patescibacteria group bacterium]|nr:DUF2156 domain-containing protein [Patescibacteria group bacterium]